MKYPNIREEELKNKVAQDFFWQYDCSKIIGNVDFCVCMHQSSRVEQGSQSIFWAEAKKGHSNINHSIVQLVLTIGKARTFDQNLPPAMLGAFDGEKIAFVPYNEIHEIFYINDFNWNVTPSNHNSKEFKLILEKVESVLSGNTLQFNFLDDEKELLRFIRRNFVIGKFGITKTQIDKNNFVAIYTKWLEEVKPTISVNWDIAKKAGIIDGDFYLADLLSEENFTLKEKLFVLLKKDHYELDRQFDEAGMFSSKRTDFSDKQKSHTQFWNRYDRPPKEEYWDYIVERRDLLVPQDVRERKGSFFTPKIWVELSQQYLAQVLGEDWQDNYYVWDCAAGTGNLLTGLTNKYNIWASTLDKQDVEVMHDRIKNGANLLDEHVFQFDFLNDDFSKLPKGLQEIISNPRKRKKLVIYINPPYAEAGDTKQRLGRGKNKVNVSNQTNVHSRELNLLKDFAKRELFVQFLARIYSEIPDCILGEFSKLKILQGPYFQDFRKFFLAELKSLFVVPANSFDNVRGNFPIGFFIWDTSQKQEFNQISATVYNSHGAIEGAKTFYSYQNIKNINDWLRPTWKDEKNRIGFLTCNSNDFQNSIGVFIQLNKSNQTSTYYKPITAQNLIMSSIYFAVRKCIPATWLNDRDQFLFPNDGWQTDEEFKTNCLTFTLFNNNIQSKYGINHWIPFTESEVNAPDKFASNFMSDFIKGKVTPTEEINIFTIISEPKSKYQKRLTFSTEAQRVFSAGKKIWLYYFQQPSCNVNASLYDIKEYFQGRNEKGTMNAKSKDEHFNQLIFELKRSLQSLVQKIEPKIYTYGFLKE